MITINELEPTWITFPNMETNLNFSETLISQLTDEAFPINVNWKYDGDQEIMKLGLLIDLIRTYTTKHIQIDIPFLPYSRMDRHEEGYHNPMSINVLQNILRGFKEQYGNISFLTLEVHNAKAIDEDLIENIIIMPQLVQKLSDDVNIDNALLVLPDKGSKVRYESLLPEIKDEITIVIGEKERDFQTHKITKYSLSTTDIDGQPINFKKFDKAIIVDDVISYGNTFIRLAQSIKELGINDIYLVAAHAEDALWKGDLTNQQIHILTTDSLNHHVDHDRNVRIIPTNE